jgi:hypothetical protein
MRFVVVGNLDVRAPTATERKETTVGASPLRYAIYAFHRFFGYVTSAGVARNHGSHL